ncbi:M16 family metallopeptidase [Fusobacterium necrophorum]|uniref:M16 family metallopeptidase n=1 Tax=Fusobacterium necrophorum TaxID=859 RepID=UPI000D1223EB|nr:pitrilysin family protein [Fusobacterium necrophorum]AVQ20557.1 peptidase M16 [Fusobacterium necrophorum subsp. funduliforme]MBR8722683.1 putative zinc protease [Fusobacterium necrophorum subsp. funduliforme]
MNEGVQVKTLSNGITVLAEKVPELQSFSLGFFVRTGARNERKEESGISHFIEHMMFKGTETRTAKELSEIIDNEGGMMNAYTSRETTVYYVQLLSSKLEIAIDVLSDMMLHSTFTEENIEKERNVIIEEIKMYEDSPEDTVHDENISFALRGIQSNSISGTPEGLKKITREHFMKYLRDQYVASNLTIVISGNFDEELLMRQLEEKMSAFPSSTEKRDYDNRYEIYSGTQIITRDTQQVHICFNTRGIDIHHPKKYAVAILTSALGGGMSARLFQKIREERGLAYSVYSYQSVYEDCGLFTTYAGTTKEAYRDVIAMIREEYQEILEHGITEQELRRCKNQFTSALMFHLESSKGRMSSIAASYMNNGRVETKEEVIQNINAVSLEDIQEVARYLFDEKYYSCTILGNIKEGEFTL